MVNRKSRIDDRLVLLRYVAEKFVAGLRSFFVKDPDTFEPWLVIVLHERRENRFTMRLRSDASVEFRFELMVKLHREGRSQTEIANLLNCSQSWVSKFLKRYRAEGQAALKIRQGARGQVARLSKEQVKSLAQMLLKGALHYHFATDNWTRERIAHLIEQQFSVVYHPSHISKVMRRLGFTLQKPRRRSFKKDAAAVERWRSETLPQLKKKGL
jgi:transposase